jgi:23S rRNA-intervening sequence protein
MNILLNFDYFQAHPAEPGRAQKPGFAANLAGDHVMNLSMKRGCEHGGRGHRHQNLIERHVNHEIISSHLKKSMKKAEELTIITKTYDLILWSCNHTSRFPRNHRFVLGERIERNLYSLLETLIQAKYTKNRQRLLEQANLTLEILRFQMRLAKDLQCLKVESYGFAAKSIDEIGRLVGGWLRSQGEEKA